MQANTTGTDENSPQMMLCGLSFYPGKIQGEFRGTTLKTSANVSKMGETVGEIEKNNLK